MPSPTINTHPSAQQALGGATATFSVAATTSGGALSYQWYQISPPTYVDKFNRANGDLTTPWILDPSRTFFPQIVGGSVQTHLVGNEGAALYNNTTPNDQFARFNIAALGTVDAAALLVLRASSATQDEYLIGGHGPLGATATIDFGSVVAGAYGALSSGTFTIAANDELMGVAVGTVKVAFLNNVPVLWDFTNADRSSGLTGIHPYVDAGSLSDSITDNFAAGAASLLSGATSSSYTTGTLTGADDLSRFFCLVTDSNGSTVTNAAPLAVASRQIGLFDPQLRIDGWF